MAENYGNRGYVIQNPPALPLSQQEMDDVYDLPYRNAWHPMYDARGGIPALEEIKFSLTSNRGCFGGCNFCALTFHQGRILQTRSHDSILREAEKMTKDPDFKGYIHDVGGPTADFRQPSCQKQLTKGVCQNRQCLFPKPCGNLTVDHTDYVSLLRKLRKLSGVKKVFIRSGVRFDYVVADKSPVFLQELVKHQSSLDCLFMRVTRNIYLFFRKRMYPGIIHTSGKCRRRRIKILHLFRRKSQITHIFCKLYRLFYRTSRMRGHKIRNRILLPAGGSIRFLILIQKLLVDFMGRFSHIMKYLIGNMFRCHTELSTDMVLYKFFQKNRTFVCNYIIKTDT